ncbi:sulfotransferase, partial [Ciceribacter ferrooxidans]
SMATERALAWRQDGRDDRFYDIDFRAMQADPIGEVRGLYAWLGEPVSDEFESRMHAWWKANSENREPAPARDPAAFGLDLDAI